LPFWSLPIAVLLVAALVAGAVRAGRRALLARIRREWGKPVHRERKLDLIAASHRSRAAEAESTAAFVDDRTWDDLNLDAIFAALDRTASTLGQHALYHRLRTSPVGHHLEAFEALVTRMSVDAPARERAQLALARLQDPHGYDLWWLGREDAVEVPAWFAAFPLLAGATVALGVLAPIWPPAIPVLVGMLLLNVIVRQVAVDRVSHVTRAFRQLAPIITTGEALQFLDGDETAPIIESLRSDVPRLRSLKSIARWVTDDPFMLAGRWNVFTGAVSDLLNVIFLYLSLFLYLDENGAFFGATELRRRGSSLVRVVAALGEVDAAVAVASFRAGRSDWTRPLFGRSSAPAVLTGLRHPLVADAVPNTIAIQPSRGALVTGSNMSGKSTFLRTVGVTTVMAQTLNTCLATEYRAPVLTVRSSIGRTDDLLAGKSYYIAEVETLLALVKASEGAASHLFLLDELFRGTNAVERVAAGQALLHELLAGANGSKPHLVLAATHDGELVDLLEDLFSPYHFEDAIGPDGLMFSHRLEPGPATTRNAIALLKLNGAPQTLIERAIACAAELDAQRSSR
jgi:hypothetical protein